MLARPELHARSPRFVAEAAVRLPVAAQRLPEVARPAGVDRLVGLLAVESRPGEVAVPEAGQDGIARERDGRRAAYPGLAPGMAGGPDDCVCGDLRLEDGRDWSRMLRKPGEHGLELRRVERRHLHHRYAHPGPLV